MGVFKEDFEGDLKGDLEGDLEGDSKGDFRGDFKHDMEGDLLSSSGQVQVWFSLQPKFNSFELDSEVGRLVCSVIVLFQHLEDVILFKNQELSEFTADLKARDEKISMLENIWFRSRENIPKQVRNSFTS